MKRFLCAAIAATVACGGTGPGEAELAGTRWILSELHGAPTPPVGEGDAGYLRFEAADQRFSASAGCNGMGGKWNSEGTDLEFSEVMSTLMACQEPLMTRERQLSEALSATTHFHISGSTLELRDDSNVLATFTSGSQE